METAKIELSIDKMAFLIYNIEINISITIYPKCIYMFYTLTSYFIIQYFQATKRITVAIITKGGGNFQKEILL